MARAYRDTQQPLKAIPYYERILALDQEQIAAREELAISLASVGRDDEAVREFKESLRRRAKVGFDFRQSRRISGAR